MKNTLLVEINTERAPTIIIGKMKDSPQPANKQEHAKMVLLDMATLCEGVVTLIHLAEQEGIRPSAESLRLCIEHLQNGFGDATYIGRTLNQGNG